MATTAIYITDDGRLLAFDPTDYIWVPHVKDLEAGKYEPRFEGHMDADGKFQMRITQMMMPLVRIKE